MKVVDVHEAPIGAISTSTNRRKVSTALGTTDVGIVFYEIAPGEKFSGLYHTHYDQEEVFYIQSGTATFRTADGPVTVGPGELIRFAPGEFQQGYNDGEKPVVGLAIGAPGPTHDHKDLEALVECPDCGSETAHDVTLSTNREGVILHCHDCATAALKTHHQPDQVIHFTACSQCDTTLPEQRDACPACGAPTDPTQVPENWLDYLQPST